MPLHCIFSSIFDSFGPVRTLFKPPSCPKRVCMIVPVFVLHLKGFMSSTTPAHLKKMPIFRVFGPFFFNLFWAILTSFCHFWHFLFIHLGPFEISKLIYYTFTTIHGDSNHLVSPFMIKCCKMLFLLKILALKTLKSVCGGANFFKCLKSRFFFYFSLSYNIIHQIKHSNAKSQNFHMYCLPLLNILHA